MYKHVLYPFLRGLLVIGVIALGCILFAFSIKYIYPFLIALLISMLINPAVTFLEKKLNIPRPLATIIIIVTIFVFILGIVFIIITELIHGTAFLAENIPVYFQSLIELIESFVNTKVIPFYQKLASLFHAMNGTQQDTINENIQSFLKHIATAGATFLQHFFLKIPALLALLPNSITIFIFTLLATVLITNDWYHLGRKAALFIPTGVHKYFQDIRHHLKKALAGYVKAQLILIFITASIIFSGLLLLRIEHALTITLFAALLDLLPFIGTGVIFIPWLAYLFLTGSYGMTISITVLFMVIIISRQILEPKILSASIGINPLLALFLLFFSIQIWGVAGIFIAPVLLIILYTLFEVGIMKQIWQFIKT